MRIRTPLTEDKERMADRIERLIKVCQDQQGTINLFLEKKLETDHNIVKAYMEVWKEIDARYDRNRYQAALQKLHQRIQIIVTGVDLNLQEGQSPKN
jgi:hypothetical protein